MTLPAGSRLGPYEILAPLGAGGMGEVYRAYDPRLVRDVAVKILPARLSDDAEALARFEREARAVAALSHPNILSIFDFGRDGDITYLVTELLEGENLRTALVPGPLPLTRTTEIATALAEGLSAAHSRGVVHRDLKPENVFITAEGVVKILDFGLARQSESRLARDDSASPTVGATLPGTVLGTLGYMSPEQARGQPADARSDIFSFGCVLYEMLAGERAFRGETAAESLAAVLRDEPRGLSGGTGRIPLELRKLVARCLEKNPAGRFPTARELALALREATAPRPRSGAEEGFESSRGIDSVAVLPFDAPGDDPDLLYLSEGVAESVTRALSRIERLRVISRSAVARYRSPGVDPARAGRELQVRAVLVGRMILRGERLSVDVELVDVSDRRQIWGQRYETATSDVYTLEEKIASGIAERLRPKLTGIGAVERSRSTVPNSEAYQLYLKGRYLWNRRPEKGFLDALDLFERSIEADPTFALSYSGLADCYNILGGWESGVLPPKEAFLKARTLARRSLEMNERSAEAHASLGYAIFSYDWDFSTAERELRRAIELDPAYSPAHHWYSHLLLPLGRTEESERESLAALAIDPRDFIMNAHLAWHSFFARDYDAAIEHAERLPSIISNHFWSPFFSGLAHEQKGQLDPAIDRLGRASARAPDSTYAFAALAHAHGLAGDLPQARRMLEELEEKGRRRYVPAYDFAVVNLGLGALEQALDLLEQSFEERSSWLIHLGVDPRLDPLRGKAQFRALIGRVGLPSAPGERT